MSGLGSSLVGLVPLDQAARTLIGSALDQNLIVEASAGTGKTTALVDRVLAVIKAGGDVSRMALVTFTIKAAGEMKFRLRKRLDEARRDETDLEVAHRLELAQAHLEEAFIGTIHSFCGQILRERPVEAGVDPLFTEATQQQQQFLFDEIFAVWLNEMLQQDRAGVRRALLRLAWSPNDRTSQPLESLAYAARQVADWRHLGADWRRDAFQRDGLIDQIVRLTREVADLRRRAFNKRDPLVWSLDAADDVAQWIERTGLQTKAQYEVAEARLIQMLSLLKKPWHRTGSGPFSDSVRREDLAELRKSLIEHLELFKRQADADFAAELKAELNEFVSLYDDWKLHQGFLDFPDLILRTRDMVRDNTLVREFLQQRYTHLFVDEFQDTDPVQAETLLLLAADSAGAVVRPSWHETRLSPGKLFAVGDPKQSIYKFRQADVGLYQKLKRDLSGRGLEVVQLSHSFRANTNLQRAINFAFQSEMAATQEGHCDYEPLVGQQPPIPDQPSLIALPVPKPHNAKGRTTKEHVKEQTPGSTITFLDWLLHDSGWQVRDVRSGELTPVRPEHVCLLFRKFDDYGSDGALGYTRRMEELGIPYAVSVTKDFNHREEVEAMVTALEAIEWPSDELSVYAALRGPLFGFADEDLFFWREAHGKLNPLRPRDEDAAMDPQIRSALDLLARLHRRRNHRPASATIADLLQATRAYAGFAVRSGGAQAVANLGRFTDLARRYEVDRGLSFRDFVGGLLDESLTGDEDRASVEEGFQGVQLMTVHKAKGLEFPIVVLADFGTSMVRSHPERFVDVDRGLCAQQLIGCAPIELTENENREHERERAEAIRLAYVAATRARDLLVVPGFGVGVEKFDSWIGPLLRATEPDPGLWRQSLDANGCPSLGEATIDDDYDLKSIRPGLHHVGGEDGHQVVWWAPLSGVPSKGRRSRPSYENWLADKGESASGQTEFDQWSQQRSATLAHGTQPSLIVVNASDVADPPPEPIEVELVRLPQVERAGGVAFGRLVHAILEAVDFTATADQVAELAALIAARQDLAQHADPATRAVERWLQHPLALKIAQSPQVLREVAVDLTLSDGRRLEGVIDLAFLDDGSWHVVDYKTDLQAETLVQVHQHQVQWYAMALREITGLTTRGTIVSL